jgi:tripartite-type tricarboxylate transporter receptor subunit TctC
MKTSHGKLCRILLLALGLSSVSFGPMALAQVASAWPTKPIRFVVPYPPGGPLDTIARVLAEQVKPTLGQAVIVENRCQGPTRWILSGHGCSRYPRHQSRPL